MTGKRLMATVESSTRREHARHVLAEVRSDLKRRALKLVGFPLVVYAVLKLIFTPQGSARSR